MDGVTAVALALAIVFNAASQVFFKSWAVEALSAWRWSWLADARVVGGVMSQVVASALWFKVLSRYPLTAGLPILTGGVFVLVTLVSVLCFDERFGVAKGLGTLLVFGGIVLLVHHR